MKTPAPNPKVRSGTPRQSFAWWCFANKGVEDETLLREAARIGYRGVDMLDEELWPLAGELGLQVAAINGHDSIDLGLNRADQGNRIVGQLEKRIELAARWEIPVLICFAGNRAGTDDENGLQQSAATLRRVAKLAEDAGVKLAVELLNSRVDHPGYQFDHLSWGRRLCESVDSAAVGILLDLYHLQIMEGDLIRRVQEAAPETLHYHTAGNPGRGEPDVSQEINYAPIYRAICATGFEGFIAHEFIPKTDVVESLERTFANCKENWVAV